MRKYLKIVISFILVIFVVSSSVFSIMALDNQQYSYIYNTVTDYSKPTQEENTYNDSESDTADYLYDSLIVTMKNNVSLQFKNFNISDFPEINAVSVENLLPYTYKHIKDKFEAISSKVIDKNVPMSITGFNYNRGFNNLENIKSDGLRSYLLNNNTVALLSSDMFSVKTKCDEYNQIIDNYISIIENNYNFLKDYDYSNYHLKLKLTLDTNDKESLINAIEIIKQREDVLSVSPNYCFKFDYVPNDEYISNQWYLDQIDYFDALNYAQSTETVTVGVLDSGINASHPDLHNNVDFSLSKSFVDDAPLTDTNGHGTSVAGIIGACSNNGIGVSGIGNNIKLVSLKVGSGTYADLGAIALALDYANEKNIDLVNCSFSTLGYSIKSFDQMEEVYGNYEGIIICASGNENKDIDNMGNFYSFPSALDFNNIISVAATDENDGLAIFSNGASNYGVNSVDLAAPGKNVFTTSANLNEGYRNFGGTSAAAPIVTGVVALIKSIHPDISTSQVRTFILDNVDVEDDLIGKVATGGIINANNILSKINEKKFIIKYNPNGGTGNTMPDTIIYYGVDNKLSTDTYVKLDNRFIGWKAHRESDNKWLYTDTNGNLNWYLENTQPNNYKKYICNDSEKVSDLSDVNNDIINLYAEWEVLSLGDVNMDGKITIDDATLLSKYLASEEELSNQQKRLADVNGDGRITVSDISAIQKIIAKQ